MIDDDNFEALKDDLIRIKQDFISLSRIIKPLTAITDLSVSKRRIAESGQFSEGALSSNVSITEVEKNRVLDSLNPVLVLN